MKWYEITVFTTQAGLEPVCARLDALGVSQVEITESRESVEAFLEQSAKYWDYVDAAVLSGTRQPCVKGYVAALPENRALLASIETSFKALRTLDVGVDLGSLRMETVLRDEEDWANNWKLYYKPLPIGERLLVCPSWEKAELNGRTLLSLDPGMAFGTGSHHTTRMCLEILETVLQSGDDMLDLGCGSGILSIAGLLLGARRATGVDIDPMAEKIAVENAARNGIGPDRYTVLAGDVLADEALVRRLEETPCAVVTANIVASVIIALCPLFPRLLLPGGTLIASGIIAERLAEVEEALAGCGMRVCEVRRSEDWCALRANPV